MLSENYFLNDTTPLEFYLSQNHPNPFSKKTTIKYCVAYKTNVQITVYNPEGEEIDNIVNEEKQPGTYEVEFNTKKYQKENLKLPDGYYSYKMFAGNFSSDKKWLCKNSLESKSSKKSIFSFLSLLIILSHFCLAQNQYQNNFVPLDFNNINSAWFSIPVQCIKEYVSTDKPVIRITKDGGISWASVESLYNLSLPDSMFRLIFHFSDDVILQGQTGSIIIITSAPIRIVLISTGREQRQYGFRFVNDSTLQITGKFKLVVHIINNTSLEKQETAVNGVSDYILLQNYPNPFNSSTKISFVIPSGARNLRDFSSQIPRNDNSVVTLKVYDILGNEVATLVNEYKPAGRYEVEFNSHSGEVRNQPDGSQGLPSGIYLYRLKAGNYIEIKKMILLK